MEENHAEKFCTDRLCALPLDRRWLGARAEARARGSGLWINRSEPDAVLNALATRDAHFGSFGASSSVLARIGGVDTVLIATDAGLAVLPGDAAGDTQRQRS